MVTDDLDGGSRMERIKVGKDWSLDFFDPFGKAELAFPYHTQTSDCPRVYSMKLLLRGGGSIFREGVLGVWRKTPDYLSRGLGGHLVTFPPISRSDFAELKALAAVELVETGGPILDHELCNLKFTLS